MSELSENKEPASGMLEEKKSPISVDLSPMQVKLKERYIIDFNEPIDPLDMNGGKAYKVNDVIDKEKLLFALVCSRETTPRQSILPYLKALNTPHLLKLIEYGTIVPPNASEATMVLIYQRPLGGRVIDDMSLPFRENATLVQNLWLELLESLQELRSYNITHRSICLANLFYLDETKKTIVLGDCAATFPAFYQPAVYETISSLMADKQGRGNGSEKNDIYALAVEKGYVGTKVEFCEALADLCNHVSVVPIVEDHNI